MMKGGGLLRSGLIVLMAATLCGCVTPSGGGKSASEMAHAQAEQVKYQPVEYVNASAAGPMLVVLPGEIKCTTASFAQKVTSNSIADFAEIELGKANFQVLERGELGPLLNEIQLAVGLGDPDALKKFKKGKFKSTKWFVKFDIVKAEQAAHVEQGFDGQPMAQVAGAAGGGGIVSSIVGSMSNKETCEIWIVGLRYKILDAGSTEQRASGYLEKKMEIGSKASSVLGASQKETSVMTLDTMVQQLTQMAVAEIDSKYKDVRPAAVAEDDAGSTDATSAKAKKKKKK